MRRQVTRATFIKSVFLPSTGSIEKTYPSPSSSKKVDMWIDSVEYPGLLLIRTGKTDAFVSLTNVEIGEFAPESTTLSAVNNS